MAAGSGSLIMAGPGFPMNPGAGRPITTADGLSGAGRGPGGLVRFIRLIVRYGRRHTSPSSDLAEAGFGVGVGFGSIGWLPIGPCDFFHPWWGGFQRAIRSCGTRRISTTSMTESRRCMAATFLQSSQVLVNDRLRRGVSGVPSESFGRGSIAARSVAASDCA